jgi:hypothetical protein
LGDALRILRGPNEDVVISRSVKQLGEDIARLAGAEMNDDAFRSSTGRRVQSDSQGTTHAAENVREIRIVGADREKTVLKGDVRRLRGHLLRSGRLQWDQLLNGRRRLVRFGRGFSLLRSRAGQA